MTGLAAQTIDVLVVDDHAVFAQSLATALRGTDGIRVVGVAQSGAEAVGLQLERSPHVILLDYQLPDVDGDSLIRALSTSHPRSRIIVLTASVDERTVVTALAAGCVGYVTKDQGLDDVLAAVRAVSSGQAVMPSHLLNHVFPSAAAPADASLTPREREILELLATGANNDAIAEVLFVSRNTVRNHVQNLMQKLGAHSRLEAVAVARNRGLLHTSNSPTAPPR